LAGSVNRIRDAKADIFCQSCFPNHEAMNAMTGNCLMRGEKIIELDRFWIALSYAGDGPQEDPAQWVVSVDYSPGLNLISRLFNKSHQKAFASLRDRIWQSLKSEAEIK
jgi:hypothetical protein